MKKYLLRLVTVLSTRSFYWRIRSSYRWVRFVLANSRFKTRHSFSNLSSDFSIISSIFRSVLRTIAIAIAFSVVILNLGSLGMALTTYISLPTWITSLFKNVNPENQGSYDGLLIGVITVIGIFLTLYLTSINTVAGTLYAKVSKQVRDLLVQERVSNVYVRILIFITIVCLCLLVAGVVWSIRPILTILMVALMGSYTVVAFSLLSWRVFLFFDPTSLADTLLWELGRWSDQAATKGFNWRDASFQTHYRKRAIEAIQAIQALVAIAHEEPYLQREALSLLLSKLSIILPVYLAKKRFIPTDSSWWNTLPEQKDWYLSDSSEVSMATSTRTSLQPKMKPDFRWLEKEFINLHLEALNACVKDRRNSVVFRVLGNQQEVFHAFGSNWDVEYGVSVLSSITQITQSFLNQPVNTSGAAIGPNLQTAERLQVVEYIGLFPIGLLLGFFQNMDTLNVSSLADSIVRTTWQRRDAPYQLGLPSSVLERAETVHRGLLFERHVEGSVISAHWYIKLFIFQSLADALYAQVQAILKLGTEHYLPLATQWSANGEALLTVQFLYRGLEFYNKLLYRLPAVETLVTELEKANLHTTLRWPTWDWKDIFDKIQSTQNELSKCLATCIPRLAMLPDNDALPDYFGQAVHTSGEECFGALVRNDTTTFQTIFPNYFSGVLSIHDVLRRKTKNWNVTSSLSASTEPLIDLCDLSGYIYFFSEFHQNPALWDICKNSWDDYFARNKERGIMEFWAYIIKSKQNFALMTPRVILRTSWKMHIHEILRGLPRKSIPQRTRSIIPIYQTVLAHPSPLVRAMGGVDSFLMSFYEGVDIFIELYLRKRSDTNGLDFGRDRDLTRILENYRKIDAQQVISQDEDDDGTLDEDLDDETL